MLSWIFLGLAIMGLFISIFFTISKYIDNKFSQVLIFIICVFIILVVGMKVYDIQMT